jgi:hypothetical protein
VGESLSESLHTIADEHWSGSKQTELHALALQVLALEEGARLCRERGERLQAERDEAWATRGSPLTQAEADALRSALTAAEVTLGVLYGAEERATDAEARATAAEEEAQKARDAQYPLLEMRPNGELVQVTCWDETHDAAMQALRDVRDVCSERLEPNATSSNLTREWVAGVNAERAAIAAIVTPVLGEAE